MLLGMSIECLLKAAIVLHRGSQVVEKKGRLTIGKLRGHDLHNKAKDCAPDFLVTDDERKLLKRLGSFVEWCARYPVPVDAESFNPVGTSSEERKAIIAFHRRLRDHLSRRRDSAPQRTRGTPIEGKSSSRAAVTITARGFAVW
jgi:hypothetical protein